MVEKARKRITNNLYTTSNYETRDALYEDMISDIRDLISEIDSKNRSIEVILTQNPIDDDEMVVIDGSENILKNNLTFVPYRLTTEDKHACEMCDLFTICGNECSDVDENNKGVILKLKM